MFARYIPDISDRQERSFLEHVETARIQLAQCLIRYGLLVDRRSIELRHSILTALAFFDIATTELGPDYMAAYGDVAPRDADYLVAIVEQLRRTSDDLRAAIRPPQKEK
jgi:hypothetical protein